jgi:Ca2+-binding RTX toxin-like protein
MVRTASRADAVHVVTLPRFTSLLLLAVVASLLALTSTAHAKTSHEGWPRINGVLLMHKADEHGDLFGHPSRHNELLGGHGNDVLHAGNAGDVLWGDYKPSGQPTTQADTIIGGAGRDFIYASHGTNNISAGAGNDYVKAHFSVAGTIDCGPGVDTLYIAHRNQRAHTIRNCERITHRTLGY